MQRFVNEEYLDEHKVKELKHQFHRAKPFSHLSLNEFFTRDMLAPILKEIIKEKFYEKQSDLFHFWQTNDLTNCEQPKISEFHNMLTSKEFLGYMHKVTGIKCTNKIDLFASLYTDTNFLLPHDDRLEGRNIAFLIYLTDLQEEDGGALALFNEKGEVEERVIPKAASFTFFAVSEKSLHAVEEILSESKRIALGGWFHGA